MASRSISRKVDLRNAGAAPVASIRGVRGEAKADVWRVVLTDNNAAVDLTGWAAYAQIVRNDGTMQINGTISGNAIEVTFPQAAYAFEGTYKALLWIVNATSGAEIAIDGAQLMVGSGASGDAIDPGTVVPTLNQLLAQLGAAQMATAAANDAAALANEKAGLANDAAASIPGLVDDAAADAIAPITSQLADIANKFTYSDNLYNPSNIVNGAYCTAGGYFGSKETYYRTGYIPIDDTKDTIYTLYCTSFASLSMSAKAVRYIVFFDTNKAYISGVQNVNNAIIPSGAKYVMITIKINDIGLAWYFGYNNTAKYTPYYQALAHASVYQRVRDVMSSLVLSSDTIQVKLLGDSITHGARGTGYAQDGDLIYTKNETTSWYVNTSGHCWANSLKSYLESKFDCVVKNYGCSGSNSYDYVYNNCAMLQTVVEADDDIVIMMIGTNDRAIAGRTPQILYNDLRIIHDYVTRVAGKKIIFMSCIPASISNETTNKNFHMEDVDHVVMKLGADINAEYISVYKLFIDYCTTRGITIDSLLTDGLHPTDDGYDVMFYLICNALGIGTKRPDATW